MQVILLERVANLGNLGTIVNVKNGFARNYLIPQGKAKFATPANLKEFEAMRKELEKIQQEKLDQYTQLGEKLANLEIKLERRAAPDGRLFGSVTNIDIVKELEKQSIVLEKSMVNLPNGAIKTISTTEVEITLHPEVKPSIFVIVEAEA